MREFSPRPEQMTEEAQAFYAFIFDGVPSKAQSGVSYILFEGNVDNTGNKIEEYKKTHPGTRAKVILKISGHDVPSPWLSACDPDATFFIMVEPFQETEGVI